MTAAPGPVRSADGDQRVILVVEDERDIAELVQFNLQQEGFAVVIAANGVARRLHRQL